MPVYAFIRVSYNIGYRDMPPYNMTIVKFIGKVSTMGDKLIIVIPKEFHKEINPLKGKQVKVSYVITYSYKSVYHHIQQYIY